MIVLITTAQMAETYSVPQETVRGWFKNGCRFIHGPRKSFLSSTEWVDEYLEAQAYKNIKKSNNNLPKRRNKMVKNCDFQVH